MPWEERGGKLVCEREFADFAAAVTFLNKVAALAEELDHHPDLLLHDYNRLRITTVTHDTGSITAKDRELAARIDAL